MIIVVFGLPGSGKSYFAKHLAEELSTSYLSSDTIRNEVLSSKSYSGDEKSRIYDIMLERCRALVKDGNSVILDATFFKKSVRQRAIDLASEISCRIVFIEVWADEKIVKERVSKKREESDADFDVYLKIKKEFEELDTEHLKLESTQSNIAEMLQIAKEHLKDTNDT